MPEYLGYESSQKEPIDYSELTGGLIDAVQGVASERQEKKDELERISNDLNTSISQYELGKDESMNNIILQGADNIRNNIYNTKKLLKQGVIKPSQYRQFMNNTDDYWTQLANSAKTYDQRMQDALARQEPDEKGVIQGSALELSVNGKYAEMGNLTNSQIYQHPESGKVYLTRLDDDGNVVSQVDVRQMNNPGNAVDNRLQLGNTVQNLVKNAEPVKEWTEGVRGGYKTIESVKSQPQYQLWKGSLIESVLSSDKAVVSTLADNSGGDYRFYYSEDEKEAIIQEALEQKRKAIDMTPEEEQDFIEHQEKQLIGMDLDKTGTYQPIVEEHHREAARERVSDEIEIQLGWEESGKGAGSYKSWYGASSGGGTSSDSSGDFATYAALRNAWTSPNKASAEASMNAINPKYRFTQTSPGEWNIFTVKRYVDDEGKDAETVTPIATGVTDPRDMAPYLGYRTSAKGPTVYQQFDDERRRYKSVKGDSKPSESKPTYTINGESYTLSDLEGMGYTADQVAQYKN